MQVETCFLEAFAAGALSSDRPRCHFTL